MDVHFSKSWIVSLADSLNTLYTTFFPFYQGINMNIWHPTSNKLIQMNTVVCVEENETIPNYYYLTEGI